MQFQEMGFEFIVFRLESPMEYLKNYGNLSKLRLKYDQQGYHLPYLPTRPYSSAEIRPAGGKTKGFFPVWLRGCLGILVIYVALAISVPSRARENRLRVDCQSHLKETALACAEYSQVWDERYPPVTTGKDQGWADGLYPYLTHKSWEVFQWTEDQDPLQERSSDYSFNAHLTRKTQIVSLVSYDDGADDGDTNASLTQLPLG